MGVAKFFNYKKKCNSLEFSSKTFLVAFLKADYIQIPSVCFKYFLAVGEVGVVKF